MQVGRTGEKSQRVCAVQTVASMKEEGEVVEAGLLSLQR